MLSKDVKIQALRGTEAVKRLRKQKLLNGHPFMINSKDLPANHCYLEYPNGKIFLASIGGSSVRDYSILKELPLAESHRIRQKFHLD